MWNKAEIMKVIKIQAVGKLCAEGEALQGDKSEKHLKETASWEDLLDGWKVKK